MDDTLRIINYCTTSGFAIIVKAILKNYGCLYDFQYDTSNTRLKGIVTFEFSGIQSPCLVMAEQNKNKIISEDDVNRLLDERNRKEIKRGFYITLSSFAFSVMNNINDINLVLIDRNYIVENWLDILMSMSDTDYTTLQKLSKAPAGRKKLKVTFPDGAVYCDEESAETLKQAICHIGIEKVASAGLEVSKEPLLTKTVNPKYAKYYKPIDDEWYITLQSDTDIRMRQLLALNIRLGLNMKVEVGTNLVARTKVVNRTHVRQLLLIEFEDGTIFGGNNQSESFVEAIEHIGSDNIKRLIWRDEPLITNYHKNKYQVQLCHGEWLTVPSSTKEKYKMLTIICSVTKVKMKLTII